MSLAIIIKIIFWFIIVLAFITLIRIVRFFVKMFIKVMKYIINTFKRGK